MKPFLALAILTFAACTTANRVATNIATDIHTPAMTTTPNSAQPADGPAAATAYAISDHPIVKLIAHFIQPEDAVTSLQINGLRPDGDKIQAQCTSWIVNPNTRARANALLDLKSTLQIAPIHPVGWLSALAEARRVDYDLRTGALQTRISAKRKELVDLHVDLTLACGPLWADLQATPARIPAELAAAFHAAIP